MCYHVLVIFHCRLVLNSLSYTCSASIQSQLPFLTLPFRNPTQNACGFCWWPCLRLEACHPSFPATCPSTMRCSMLWRTPLPHLIATQYHIQVVVAGVVVTKAVFEVILSNGSSLSGNRFRKIGPVLMTTSTMTTFAHCPATCLLRITREEPRVPL